MAVVRAYAKHRRQPMRAIYDDAITAMVNRIAKGEKVFFPASIPGQGARGRHIRLTSSVAAAMAETCEVSRVHRSVFFLRAVRDYLSSKGIDVPD